MGGVRRIGFGKTMKIFHSQWSSHPLFQFTWSYIIMILIIFIMAANVVLSTRRTNEQSSIQVNLLVLEHTVENIENSLNSIDLFTELLYSDSSLCAFLNKAYQKSITADEMIPIISALPSLSDSNAIIENYFIYSPTQSFIITNNQGYLDISKYYNENYLSYSNYTYDEWCSVLQRGCNESVALSSTRNTYKGESRESILLITPYINYNTGQSLGSIVFYLNSSQISKILSATQDTGSSYFSVWDKDGQVLLSTEEKIGAVLYSLSSDVSGSELHKIGKENMQVTYLKSQICHWTFALAIERNSIIQKSWEDSKSVITTAIILFIISFFIAAWLMLQNRRPLLSIVSKLHPNMELAPLANMKNGLWQLSHAISELSTNHQELVNVYYEQQLQLKNIFISRLTSGDISDDQNIEQALSQLGVDIQGISFCGIYMRISSQHLNEDNLEQSRIILKLKQYSQLKLLSQIDSNTFQLILAMDENTNYLQEINQILPALHGWLKEAFGLESRFCVGYPCSKLYMLHHSFSAAKSMLDIGDDGRFILIREKEPKRTDNYVYLPKHKQAFIKYLNAGSPEEVSELLHLIYEQNFTHKQLSDFSRKLLYSAIVNSLIESDSPNSFNEEFLYTFLEQSPAHFFASVTKTCTEICLLQQQRYQQERNELTQNILKYIRENLSDYNMTLSLLSMKFGMTENYISFYIKENAGVNFLTYLEKLRIEEANRLLMAAVPVTEIASCVGYVNVNSFRRFYHRNQGISPSEYREQMHRKDT